MGGGRGGRDSSLHYKLLYKYTVHVEMATSLTTASKQLINTNPYVNVFHKPIIIYMGGLILGINTLYRLFCFFKLFGKRVVYWSCKHSADSIMKLRQPCSVYALNG